MNYIKLALAALYFISLLACAPKELIVNQPAKPVQSLEAATSQAIPSSQKAGWQDEWEKVIRGARKESQALLYGGPGMATVHNLINPMCKFYGHCR